MNEIGCRIFFRIPFTRYWLGQVERGHCHTCGHRCFEPLSLFTKEFRNGYSWEEVTGRIKSNE